MKKTIRTALSVLIALMLVFTVSCAKEEGTVPEKDVRNATFSEQVKDAAAATDPDSELKSATDIQDQAKEMLSEQIQTSAPKTYKAVEDGLIKDPFSYAYGYGVMQTALRDGLVFPGGWFARGVIDLLSFNEHPLVPVEEIPDTINKWFDNFDGKGDKGMPIADVFLTLQWGEPETEDEKFAYCYGFYTALKLINEGIMIDMHDFPQGVITMLYDMEPLISIEDMGLIVKDWVLERQKELDAIVAEIGEENLKLSEAKLAEVAAVEGNIKVSDLLVLEPMAPMASTGRRATAEDTVTVTYTLKDIEGKQLDHGDSVDFDLQRVIPGFREAILQMRKGDEVRAYVHPSIGYGPQGAGTIAPNALLIFEVKFENVVK